MNKAKIIKIIDLLQKIANNEEIPKKIKVRDYNFIYDNEWEEYLLINKMNDNTYYLSDYFDIMHNLNEEIEILEEPKKIDKLEFLNNSTDNEDILRMKINEIIDKLNEEEE